MHKCQIFKYFSAVKKTRRPFKIMTLLMCQLFKDLNACGNYMFVMYFVSLFRYCI